ncbi:MAG TPA: DUF2157 domain-containing protein [Methylomirabilota bacterium]|nr:DUF2157 domain-containing protein [Methylomirabilota bacterium]
MADRFAARLAREVREWVSDGLVSPEQAERLLARYPDAPGWYARPTALFALIGGGLIAAGIALVVAHNWEEIHRWVKLGGLILLMLAAHGSGLGLRERGHPWAASGCFLIGGSLLLVGIALVGQIYNLSGRPADAVLLWWVLLLPVGLALPSAALAGVAYVGLAAWFLTALWDPLTWLGRSLEGSFFYPDLAIAAFGLILFAIGILHGDGAYRGLGRLLEQLGLVGVVGALLPLGFSWSAWELGRLRPASATVLGLLLLALVASLASAWRLPSDTHRARAGFLGGLVLLLAYLAACTLAIAVRTLEPWFPVLRVVNWFLVFALASGLIVYGARWERSYWVNWGLAFIGIHAVARYVDLIGSLLGTSLLFFSAGVLALALGWTLERMRRRMLGPAVARAGQG